ncbi:MAG: hypothetical protein IJB84_03805 [Lachnospiraceae bacterium]|nr:hypothetical protein [Lachnospiraceae bacterium]
MTSKHSFFKYMIQDLRHRVWMIALSTLACFLAFPVGYLIWEGNSGFGSGMTPEAARIRYAEATIGFFAEYPIVLGGVIAIVGALIVGIFGFRFVFRRKMVDLYHSLPITRNQQFWVTYLNGFLIWFVPFVVSMLITVVMAYFNVSEFSGIELCAGILPTAATCVGVLIVSFLLMYHLVLVAVMLSGNILNALVCIGIIGISVFAVFCTGDVFLNTYMDTYYGVRTMLDRSIFASPFISSFYQLYWLVEDVPFAPIICANIVVALLLGGGAWYLYKVRASELAEQGVRNPIATFIMKIVVTVVAGMVGWFIFTALGGRYSVGWGVFGAVLASVLTYGVLDIIFHMDFKAFFASKLWMGVSTMLAILLCLTFSRDWIGYDTYVPDAEDIEEAGILIDSYQNHERYPGSAGGPLELMHYDDAEHIRKLLETGVENLEYEVPFYGRWIHGDVQDRMDVKVTLKNGRSYYRSYKVYDKDKEVVWPLICSDEYVNTNFRISEKRRDEFVTLRLRRYNGVETQELGDVELIRQVVDAYNKDLTERPEAVIAGEGRMLVNIQLRTENYYHFYISVYEGMTNTIAALQGNPWCEKYLVPTLAEEIEYVDLELGFYSKEEIYKQGYTYELLAKERYGLLSEEELETLRKNYEMMQNPDLQNELPAEMQEMATVEWTEPQAVEGKDLFIIISDPAEIQELVDVMSYGSPDRGNGAFTKYFIGIRVVDIYGVEKTAYIREGDLPEKFIARFAELETE